jgi:Protein of unknown function (DUF2946)
MTMAQLRTHRHRYWISFLLLPALLFRLFVPAGFMPGLDEGFSLTMQMCHGGGANSLLIRYGTGGQPMDGGSGTPDKTASHDAPCVFAASGVVAPPPSIDLPSGQEPRPVAATVPPLGSAAPSKTHRNQSPRAPPVLS